MSSEQRTTIKTYIPAYQKEIWTEHAEELGMSQSEYVRTMIQAGRRKFSLPDDGSEPADDGHPPVKGANLKDRIISELADGAILDRDELSERLLGSIEDDLFEGLEELQNEQRLRYDVRNNGFQLIDHEHH